jgi:hypothetical protein
MGSFSPAFGLGSGTCPVPDSSESAAPAADFRCPLQEPRPLKMTPKAFLLDNQRSTVRNQHSAMSPSSFIPD